MAENPTIAALRAGSNGLRRASGPEALNFPWMNGQQSAINFTPRRASRLNNPQRLSMPEAAPFEIPYMDAMPTMPPPRDPFEIQFSDTVRGPLELNMPELDIPLTVPVDMPPDFGPIEEPEGEVTVYEEIEMPELNIPESTPVTYVPPSPIDIPVDEPDYSVDVEEVPQEPVVPAGGGAETVAGPSGGGYDNFLINLWLSQLYSPQGVVTVEEVPDEPTSRLAR